MENTEDKEIKMEEVTENVEEVKAEEVSTEPTDEKQLKEMSEVVEAKEKAEDEKVSKAADTQFKKEEGRGEYKRESREDRFAREAREKLDAWIPKTQLGRDVRAGKVKNIDEIFERCEKIMEPQIVDLLIPGLKTDMLFIGQSKGKFGGGKRRAFRQTQKATKEGNVMTFGVMAVVGDSNGHIGVGYGRASETLPAKEKAIRKAKLNLVKIELGCGSYDCSCDGDHSVPLTVEGKCSSVRIKLMPAPQGTGLVVSDEMKKILRLVGIKDVYSKCSGKVNTTFNTAKACMKALEKIGELRL
ncbi:30S ribosomal protein S5 [archaeon]|jgi:small subunit ribosomal protein S5|nr:30S ribosomal protein S5 [archaeon]MBT6606122.1 30S ribosomal protein S5 [archaeon]MBT7252038.1 30S ribosomal protein S5 [archaeon]MBT7661013.1 30S ribosomal protein S5 [archaeon]